MVEKNITGNEEDFQIRRPNRLFDKPLKKNLALLFDVLCFNFYGKNPEDREFKISWVELQQNYGINTGNKDYIKEKLSELQNENFISDLKTWNYGFSYKFEDTFLSYDEILEPKTWTFLNFSLMKKLDFISYKLYTLAYKFFNFRKDSHHKFENQTKFLEIDEFLQLFNQSASSKNGVAKNRLIAKVREAIEKLKELGIEIEMQTKVFGRPIIAVKLIFKKVPKLKKIISKAVDFTVKTTKRAYQKAKSIWKDDENWREYSAEKVTKERMIMVHHAENHIIQKFVVDDFFPAVVRSNLDFLQSMKEWIMDNFADMDTRSYKISLEDSRAVFDNYQKTDSFKKMYKEGAFDKELKHLKIVNDKASLDAVHPTITTIKNRLVVW